MKIKTYQKDFDYTYTLGVFETIELLKYKPQQVIRVYLKSNSYTNQGVSLIQELCQRHQIEVVESDKTINKLSKKNNCFAIAILNKYDSKLNDGNHIVLVNPGDMGNMGTIIRTMMGFDYHDLVIIRPGVDVFSPRVIRSSMGAIFRINFTYFDSFDDYLATYPDRQIFPLMLKGAKNIHQVAIPDTKYSLVFGNESSGLPDEYLNYGQTVFIPHSNKIDSLNLSMALGITLYHFSKNQFKDQAVLNGML
ncbi:TrmH family RNA methyltransferase [uncultured Thomasclavelia sp.]|uniref:TrmH family RNA methyltransferase n=1 Tax=uncultured Thomasclavelia sp. TaxID=3025759 RepID=UPI0025D80B7E|nr:TrmH family RNA methyltransferase [uncultured Thomasclavelia sp.]